MCGIAGVLTLEPRDDLEGTLERMGRRLRHRGPDDQGTWQELNGLQVGLAHARLSILDLSLAGHQPMASSSGRFQMVYNGEVYNYRELREELETLGHRFLGGSDTEVILAAIAEWGTADAAKRFVGMFAFAVWDREQRCLTLCRDRIGIKPLFLGISGQTMVFASELKPFREVSGFPLELDRDSLTAFLRFGYVPSPYSIFRDVAKLPPGHVITLTEDDLAGSELPESEPFWSARNVVSSRGGGKFTGSAEEAVDALDEKLREAVSCRMIADVPLGAFLSGGIDSSAVVALMQAESTSKVKSFSIGLEEVGYNEATHAKSVAEHLGTDHTELYIRGQDAQAVIPDLPRFYDEPFADSSQIPTHLVSRLAREQVTVTLSGDGGDELFAGYNRYGIGLSVWKTIQRLPRPARGMVKRGLRSLRRSQWDSLYEKMEWAVPSKFRMRIPGYRAHKLADMLEIEGAREMYESLVSHWTDPGPVVLGGEERAQCRSAMNQPYPEELSESFIEQMMYYDLVAYLPEDILTKLDRASMAVSLESRVPLIDHRVVEFAWSLPLDYKLRNGDSKWVLREVLARYVPRELFERPKMGFGIPVERWLREDLRDWAEELLEEGRLQDEGIFDASVIRGVWEEHLSEAMDWQFLLWDILMFQAWWQSWRSD